MKILAFRTVEQAVPQQSAPNRPLRSIIDEFVVDLAVAGRQPATRKRHAKELRRFDKYLTQAGLDWRTMSEADLRAYLRAGSHRAIATQANTVATLRAFYAWSVHVGLLPASPAVNLKSPKREKPTPRALTREQVRLLIRWLGEQEGMKARRDEALVLTALYTGLRASELARLRWDDLDFDEGILLIELSKMNHGRATALPPALIPWLKRWRELQEPRSNFVFASLHDGAPIVPERVGKIVRRIGRQIGIDNLHTHRLRHSFATWALRTSRDLYAVSKALGHKELKQTEIYIAPALGVSQIAGAVAHLPNLNEW